MRLYERLFRRRPVVEPERFDAGAFLGASYAAGNSERILPTFLNAASLYHGNGVVFGVVLARLSLFTEAEFKFQRLSDKTLYGTEALAKLENPWPGGTTGELLARMEQDVSLAGNAFIVDHGATLGRLRPDWVTIVSEIAVDPVTFEEHRRCIGYIYDPVGDADLKATWYPVERVAHWSPIPDPLANYRGMSWLTPVIREIDADAQLTDYKRSYLTNAATPNMVIRYSQKLGAERLKRLADVLQAKHGGVDNAFRTLVLDEGADTTVLGNNFEQMQFAAVQAAGENRIAVAGGVPAIVAGLKEGLDAATYSNYELAMRRFADLTMRPNWRSACAALAKLVDVPSDSRLWYDTVGIAALRQGNKELAETMQVLARAAGSLVAAGYEPDTITAALTSGDLSLLKHTGLASVQMQSLSQTHAGRETAHE